MINTQGTRWKMIQILGWSSFCLIVVAAGIADAASTRENLALLQKLQANDDQSQKNATNAVQQLKAAKDLTLLDTLRAMKDASPLGKNWLSGIANSLYRSAAAGDTATLNRFLDDSTQDSEARYLVFGWLMSKDDASRKAFLVSHLEDPSPEIRFDAVQLALDGVAKDDAKKLQSILEAARHPDQVTSIIAKLKEAGVAVDQAQQFGLLTKWRLMGPFDNVGTKNFDRVFDVERDSLAGKVRDRYEGKSGEVTWISHESADPNGIVDVAKIYANEKGCIVYGEMTFVVPQDTECEVRFGSWNAHKVWVNNELVISNEVYHTNMQIDQFASPVKLKAGPNRVFIKLSQNEQTEVWAQSFSFQIRFCDSTGKAIVGEMK